MFDNKKPIRNGSQIGIQSIVRRKSSELCEPRGPARFPLRGGSGFERKRKTKRDGYPRYADHDPRDNTIIARYGKLPDASCFVIVLLG